MARNTERERNIKQGLRLLQAAYKRADSAGERFERELKRLRMRKTLIEPEDVDKLTDYWTAYTKAVDETTGPMTNTLSLINY